MSEKKNRVGIGSKFRLWGMNLTVTKIETNDIVRYVTDKNKTGSCTLATIQYLARPINS